MGQGVEILARIAGQNFHVNVDEKTEGVVVDRRSRRIDVGDCTPISELFDIIGHAVPEPDPVDARADVSLLPWRETMVVLPLLP